MSRNVRLGRLPHDPARIAAAPQLVMGAAPVPPVIDRSSLTFAPGMYGNDILPDCTAAGLANQATAFSWVHSGSAPVIAAAKVPAFYALCVGCADNDAAMEATDGAVLQDVLERARDDSVDFGEQVGLVPNFSAADPASRQQLAHMLHACGGGYWGVVLTNADMENQGIWDADGPDNSGIAGGHCLVGWDYTGLGDTDIVRLATWGMLQKATWRWVAARIEEAWLVEWNQLIGFGA